MHLLLLEDDRNQIDAVNHALDACPSKIEIFARGVEAVQWLKKNSVDVCILDWNVQGTMTGSDVLRWIRAHIGYELPVMLLAAKELEIDIMLILGAGADDYVIKPFRPLELAARVMSLSRRIRKPRAIARTLQVGRYMVDLDARSIHRGDDRIELTPKEFDLISFLFINQGKVVSRDVMARTAWGREVGPASRTLDTHMYRIRQKLALEPENGVRLSAVYARGYRLDAVS